MEVPRNDNQPQALPLTSSAVKPEYLMMAAAGMRAAGNYPAYNSGATFADNELSKNVQDRRGFSETQNMAAIIDAMQDRYKAQSARQGKTPELDTQDTSTSRRMRRIGEGGDTPSDMGFEERGITGTPR